jgi:hypothetical protein
LRRHLIATALVLAASAAPAQAAGPQWATVNVCGQGAVGIRASIPGDGSGKQMYAQMTTQWLNPATRAWEPVEGSPSSPWLSAGRADQNASQVGWTFQFDPVPAGRSYSIRGVAVLAWKRGATAVRQQTLVTSGGALGVGDGGSSLGTCTLR